jgi:hypothetical protein
MLSSSPVAALAVQLQQQEKLGLRIEIPAEQCIYQRNGQVAVVGDN